MCSDPSDDGVVSRETTEDEDDVLAYWTEERKRKAKPRSMVVDDEADDEAGDEAEGSDGPRD